MVMHVQPVVGPTLHGGSIGWSNRLIHLNYAVQCCKTLCLVCSKRATIVCIRQVLFTMGSTYKLTSPYKLSSELYICLFLVCFVGRMWLLNAGSVKMPIGSTPNSLSS